MREETRVLPVLARVLIPDFLPRNVMVAHPERALLSKQVGPKEYEGSQTPSALLDPTCLLNSVCEGLASITFRFNNLVGI